MRRQSAAQGLRGGWLFLCLLMLFYLPSCAWMGSVVAHVDHLRGHYELKTFGSGVRWRFTYGVILKERYGVTLNIVAGCVVTPWLVDYVLGYNGVSEKYIERKHGAGVLDECAKKARLKWRQVHEAEMRALKQRAHELEAMVIRSMPSSGSERPTGNGRPPP